MSEISNKRLADLVLWLDRKWARHKEEEDFEAAAALRELQLLRASAPVLSEEQREALEAGARSLDYCDPTYYAAHDRDQRRAQAALLRGMAQSG